VVTGVQTCALPISNLRIRSRTSYAASFNPTTARASPSSDILIVPFPSTSIWKEKNRSVKCSKSGYIQRNNNNFIWIWQTVHSYAIRDIFSLLCLHNDRVVNNLGITVLLWDELTHGGHQRWAPTKVVSAWCWHRRSLTWQSRRTTLLRVLESAF